MSASRQNVGCYKYKPEFLVKDKTSNKLLPISVKPDRYTDDAYLGKRKSLLEEYIWQLTGSTGWRTTTK